MLSRSDFALIAALEIKMWGPPQLHEFMVPRHAEAEQRIVNAVKKFWADIEAGIPPQPDFTRDGALIMAMHNVAKGKMIDLTADNRLPELLAERERLKAKEAEGKEAEEVRKALDAEIVSKMGDAELALTNGWRIKAKEIHRKEHIVVRSQLQNQAEVLQVLQEATKALVGVSVEMGKATDYRLVTATRTEQEKPKNTDDDVQKVA
jgi:predicted phage-related endonuclease